MVTKSEIDLLGTVYIASATMHTTAAQIDCYFYLHRKVVKLALLVQLFSVFSCHTTGKASPETLTISHLNSQSQLPIDKSSQKWWVWL